MTSNNSHQDDTSSSLGFSKIGLSDVESCTNKSGISDSFATQLSLVEVNLPQSVSANHENSPKRSSSFALVENPGKSAKKDDRSSCANFSSSWCLVGSSEKEDGSLPSTEIASVACPLCTFLNRRTDAICQMCESVLDPSTLSNEDETLASFLQQDELGFQENIGNQLGPDPTSQALLKRSRIVANDILAAIQLLQEEESTAKKLLVHKQGYSLQRLRPLPEYNLSLLVSRFLECSTQMGNHGTKLTLCYCVTDENGTDHNIQNGLGPNQFGSTPEAAVLAHQHGIHLQRYRPCPTNNYRRPPWMRNLLGTNEQKEEQQTPPSVATIQPNTTGWIVAILHNNSEDDYPILASTGTAQIYNYNRDEIPSLPLVSFPAEMIYQDSVGRLFQSLSRVCHESFAEPEAPPVSPVAARVQPNMVPSPGWSSIKKNDRVLPYDTNKI